MTPQRQAVLDVLAAADDHPTATEVYDRVRDLHPGIGAATVYRTLAMLVESGQALELTLGDGSSARYDGNVARHDHVVCDGCGRAVDVQTPLPRRSVASAVTTLSRDTGFSITGYDLQFRGRCPACVSVGGTTTHEE
jgi:Fur family ferric uptake transcriptional regulator/Fur family peroxide stress response transcriptional regulator